MKILHCADIHLGDLNGPIRDGKNARRQDTLDCMSAITEAARRELPDVSIIAGDLFNRSRVWADTALEDINDAINHFIRPLCQASDHVVLLFGTASHDNPLAFQIIEEVTANEDNLHIFTRPDVCNLYTKCGSVQILALPGFDKGRLRTFVPDADKETENRNATALINEVLLGLSTKLDKGTPSVLVAHYTVAGADMGNGATFLAGQDVVLLPQTIDSTGVTLACLGHIHKQQRIFYNTPTFYSGSPNQLTFTDEESQQGFYIHEITDEGVQSTAYSTPARRHFTLEYTESDLEVLIIKGEAPIPDGIRDAIVRVRYRGTCEQEKALNKAELQRQLLAAGAFHVAEIMPFDRDDSIDAYEELGDDSPTALLNRYLESVNERGTMSPSDIERLKELAAPLILLADDGREADRHVGAFVPKRIEVKNYRSYSSATFDFADIRMAMVNGSNGVGKSSLFMDAIADCLFEISRDDSVGGWVRQGEKSGAITFEFEIGGINYRVSRTRTKSGKGTLAFNRINDNGEWEDCGDTTIRLTQAKIELALGMDCQTFCSVALIRQDAYGLFLEADSDRRMEVLSALLNLGVFVRLEELAKIEASNQRKNLASLKDRMSILAQQIETKEATETELREVEQEVATVSKRIEELEAMIASAQREEALRQEVKLRADEKEREAAALEEKASEKETALAKLTSDRDEALRLADMVDAAEKAVEAVTTARAELERLAPREEELRSKTQRRDAINGDIKKAQAELFRIAKERSVHTELLNCADEIRAAVETLENVRGARSALNRRMSEYSDAKQAVASAEAKRIEFLAETRQRQIEIEMLLETAQKKAALLQDSGCPILENATCAFLKDANEANGQISGLENNLEKVKDEDWVIYLALVGDCNKANAVLSELDDPGVEIQALDQRERSASPIASLSPKLEVAAASIAELDRQEASYKMTMSDSEKESKEITESLKDLQVYAAQAAGLRESIKCNEPTAALHAKCTAAKATAEALLERMSDAVCYINSTREAAKIARLSVKEIRESIHESTSDVDALQRDKKAKEDVKTALAKRTGSLNEKLELIADAHKQHEEYRVETSKAARDLNDYSTLAQCFGIDGIQYMIIRSVVPEIMHRANDILAAMTGGRMAVDFRTEREQKSNQKIVNSLDVWITSLNGGSRPYSSHSGGEKVKIALAVTLALADVKARRAGIQLGMLQIDEPPFLDADGTDAYADALNNMAARNPNIKILAISHDPVMAARFPQRILVHHGDNGSWVSMEEC